MDSVRNIMTDKENCNPNTRGESSLAKKISVQLSNNTQRDDETRGEGMDWQLVERKGKGGKKRLRSGGNNAESNMDQSEEEDSAVQTDFSPDDKQQRNDSAITTTNGDAPMGKGNEPNITPGIPPITAGIKKECYVNSNGK